MNPPRHPTRPELVLIAAVARNGVIGRNGGLVFQEPADQRHFRQATLGCPVIMGRKTWDSLPPRFRPLPGRRNIVVSRRPGLAATGAEVAPDLPAALAAATDAPRVFVIGGAQLYAQALPLAQRLMLTEVDAELPGDVFFPAWDRNLFVETRRQRACTDQGMPYHFVEYQRRQNGSQALDAAAFEQPMPESHIRGKPP
ncbi:MAG: dihydrofolate reductase [Rubrivivax sp.]|nr:dihydrofolate reductase [Rubrivivax sp.]